jgi:hypothetical protein
MCVRSQQVAARARLLVRGDGGLLHVRLHARHLPLCIESGVDAEVRHAGGRVAEHEPNPDAAGDRYIFVRRRSGDAGRQDLRHQRRWYLNHEGKERGVQHVDRRVDDQGERAILGVLRSLHRRVGRHDPHRRRRWPGVELRAQVHASHGRLDHRRAPLQRGARLARTLRMGVQSMPYRAQRWCCRPARSRATCSTSSAATSRLL